MSFLYKRSLLPNGGPSIVTVIIDNSDDLNVGDAVKCRNGNLEKVTAGDAVFGVIHDIVDSRGLSLTPQKGTLASLGDATRATDGTITVGSDNETDNLIAAKVDISQYSVYSATVTGTISTTATSNKPGAWINTDDEDSLDETTATRTITTGGQFQTVPSLNPSNGARDDDDTTRLLVHINESEFFDNGAALA